jgi:hypothetical protein
MGTGTAAKADPAAKAQRSAAQSLRIRKILEVAD